MKAQSLAVSVVTLLILSLSSLGAAAVPAPAGIMTTLEVDWYGDGPNFADLNPGDGVCLDMFGGCALRTALQEANAHTGPDVITFASPMDITLSASSGALPSLDEQVTIDASSVWDSANNRPGVSLSCDGMNANGLSIWADSCAIYGLKISYCNLAGISISSAYNTIGGTAAGQRNVLAGNGGGGNGTGITVTGSGAHHNLIQNNYVGLNAAGTVALPNYSGIEIRNSAADNTVRDNVVSGNSGTGIEITGSGTDDNQVGSNLIGLAADGATPMANGNRGLVVQQATGTQIGGGGLPGNSIAHNSSIGVDLQYVSQTTLESNAIHHNDGAGVYLIGSDSNLIFNTIHSNNGDGVRITGAGSLRNQVAINSIYGNTGLGIQLENGANNILPAPVITSADATVGASGTISGGGRVVYVYSDNQEEGQVYHGLCIVDTATGQWSYSGIISGPNATALATDADGNTSRFSVPLAVSGALSGTCTNPLPISCGQKVSNNTTGGPSEHDFYGCGYNASGPELIYALTLPPGPNRTITAEISNLAPSVDLDVYLLDEGGCSTGSCLRANSFGDWTAIAESVPPGTYYVAVDGYYGSQGSFDLALDCGTQRCYLPMVLRNP